jgi:hypothetical protein
MPRRLLYHEEWGVGPVNIVPVWALIETFPREDIMNFAFSTLAINRLYWVDSWEERCDHDE